MFALLDAPAAAVAGGPLARAEPGAAPPSGSSRCRSPIPPAPGPVLDGLDLELRPGRRSRWSARAARGRAPSPRCCSACSSPPADASSSAASTSRSCRDRRVATADRLGAPASDAAARHDRGQHPARRIRARPTGWCATRPPAPGRTGSSARCRTATRPWSATVRARSRRASAAGSGSPGRSSGTRRSSSSTSRPPTSTRTAWRWWPAPCGGCRRGGRVLVIAHRPELIQSADRVVRLVDGAAVAAAVDGGRVNATLPALLRLVAVPRRRLAAAAALGALTVVFGVGLMATSGYLISRAAEQPPILSLMVAVAAVQAFGIGRPIVALPRAPLLPRRRAALARPPADALLRAHRAARPGGARELSQGRPARAHGRRRRRAAEPVPARPAAAHRRAHGRRRRGRRRGRVPARRRPRARRGPAHRRARRAGAVGSSRRSCGAAPGRGARCAVGRAGRADRRRPRARRVRRPAGRRWPASAPPTRRSCGSRGATRSPPASATARACSSPASPSPACSPSRSRPRLTGGSTTC